MVPRVTRVEVDANGPNAFVRLEISSVDDGDDPDSKRAALANLPAPALAELLVFIGVEA